MILYSHLSLYLTLSVERKIRKESIFHITFSGRVLKVMMLFYSDQ